MKFNCSANLMDVMITIECFRFKEKYTAVQEGREVDENVDSPYYLLAISDAIMNTMTKANGKKVSLMLLSGVLSLYFHLKYCKSAAASRSVARLLFHHVFNTNLDVQIGEFIGTVCWSATMLVVGYYIHIFIRCSLTCLSWYVLRTPFYLLRWE